MPQSVHQNLRIVALCLLTALVGCSSYKQNIMFKPADNYQGAAIPKLADEAAKNYIIATDDYLKLEVFANNGERIIDPNFELLKTDGQAALNMNNRSQVNYLVGQDGTVRLPMVGAVALVGMTKRDAEIKLQGEFNKYYKDCYVVLTFINKRVIVLGALGGQVIPLANENITVVEVLALAKGIGNDGKAGSIRLIRGDQVFMIDLSTIDGLGKTNMKVEPGDVVYVEPVRRPFVEGFRDTGPVISLVLSFLTLLLLYANTK